MVLFFVSSGLMQPSAIHENDNDMNSNYDNNSNFASNQSFAFTPDNMGDKMKKGPYIYMSIWLFNN